MSEIMEYLNNHPGEFLSPYAISKKTNYGIGETRRQLAELASAGKIRRAGTQSALTYYIPSEVQLANEARALEKIHHKPLAPRPLMAERLEQIRAERVAYPSIC
jgi:DNA-binding IclR family transcriptional regulator